MPADGHNYRGLYLASERVFWALTVVAVACIVVLLLTPRQWRPLRFPDDELSE